MADRPHAVLPVVAPIVPVPHEAPFDDPAYLFEPKFDGVRAVLYLSARGASFRSKLGMGLARFAELAQQVRERLGPVEAILDGEVVAVWALFRAAQQLDLEGIVAKRQLEPYAASTVWLTIRNLAYTQIRGRAELFRSGLSRRR